MTASASPGDGPLAETFDAYRLASNRAWRTYQDYRAGEATDAQAQRDSKAERDAEAAHRAAIAQAVTAHAGEGGAVERAAEVLAGTYHGSVQGCLHVGTGEHEIKTCEAWGIELAEALADAGLLAAHAEVGPVGTTVREWGVFLPDDDPDYTLPLTFTTGEGNVIVFKHDGEAAARHIAGRGVGRSVVTRQRTTFPDVVTDWTEVTDD